MGEPWWKKFKVDDLPAGTSGDVEVYKFEVSAEDEEFGKLRAAFSFSSAGRYVSAGTYTGLRIGGRIMMSDTRDEIADLWEPIHRAYGRCLVNGLGLGIVVNAMLTRTEVERVTAVEINPDVIALVAPYYAEKFGDRFEVVEADALTYRPPKGVRYGYVWHDIWPTIVADNLDQMKTLHRRYGRRADAQGSWCRKRIERRHR